MLSQLKKKHLLSYQFLVPQELQESQDPKETGESLVPQVLKEIRETLESEEKGVRTELPISHHTCNTQAGPFITIPTIEI
jgi:hypothetical protein